MSAVVATAALGDAGRSAVRLAALERLGVVRRGHQRPGPGLDTALPVASELRSLLPHGLARGGTVAVAGSGPADTSLLLLLLSAASKAGSWCALVGLPTINPAAAAEAGIDLGRLALVPNPGTEWSTVVAALLDGVDVVAVVASQVPQAAVCGRLAARARQRGTVLVPFGGWHQPDLLLSAERAAWEGLGHGRGRVQCREVSIVASGRGAAARPRRATVWLPQPSGLYAERRSQRHAQPAGDRPLTAVPIVGRAKESPGSVERMAGGLRLRDELAADVIAS
ncbi:hypothetical protein ABZS66_28130 [Dactylosporangium sp. NPDC005572]|uniref:hypothetical protein n=1 Tax=Dactylosporangium sp. NPDC005572 TaxID=3156889 RepID=UPI0033A8CB39